MRSGDWPAAQRECRLLNELWPQFADGWLAASQIALARKSPPEALQAVDRALAIEPGNPGFALHRAQCLLTMGRRAQALEAAAAAQRRAGRDPRLWDAIGTLKSYAADQRGALEAYEQAVMLAPQDPHYLFNRASVRRFLGDLEGAEADYDRVIAHRPADFEAYLNRSELRRQTAVRNHLAELEALAARPGRDWRGEVQLRYALAKECEDLGLHEQSFRHLLIGSRLRREHLQYDVALDVATVGWIIEAFERPPPPPSPAASTADPIFIVGLPRSGTTLIERILSSHSAIRSAGELDSFALSLVEAAQRVAGRPRLARRELVAAAARLDFAELGRDYLARARALVGESGRFTDKMPLNYLYCGLIRRALPAARIVHVVREPMAVCHAMYKTLFKSGYPFSYDLGEIAQYYGAYRRLMAHWRDSMPGVIHDIRYEALIADQAGETRKLLDYCGLDWEEGCLAFHRNAQPSTTASASQVRRPLYDTSVELWRRYERELGDLKDRLTAQGIEVAGSQRQDRGKGDEHG